MKGISIKAQVIIVQLDADAQTKALVLEYIADARNAFFGIGTNSEKGIIKIAFRTEEYAKRCKQYIKDNS